MTYFQPTPKPAGSPSSFLRGAAMLASAIVAIGYAGSVSADPLAVGAGSTRMAYSSSSERILLAQATGEETMERCRQLSGLWSRHNTNGYARPMDVDLAIEDCRKGNYAAGVAALKRALERAQIAIPSTESAKSR